jgi:hypothetical protein
MDPLFEFDLEQVDVGRCTPAQPQPRPARRIQDRPAHSKTQSPPPATAARDINVASGA